MKVEHGACIAKWVQIGEALLRFPGFTEANIVRLVSWSRLSAGSVNCGLFISKNKCVHLEEPELLITSNVVQNMKEILHEMRKLVIMAGKNSVTVTAESDEMKSKHDDVV